MSACAHTSPLGNISGAICDLWSNEIVHNVKLLACKAQVVNMEEHQYGVRLFKQEITKGKESLVMFQR